MAWKRNQKRQRVRGYTRTLPNGKKVRVRSYLRKTN